MGADAGVTSVRSCVTWKKWHVTPGSMIGGGEEVKVVGFTYVLIFVKFASPVVSTIPPDHVDT
jgi:hypothetical protein